MITSKEGLGCMGKYWKRAQSLIPGGAHTYSKGDDQFPENAPKLISRGKGSYLWDMDGKKYTDLAMSLGTMVLGHANDSVDDAVCNAIRSGINFCRPSYLEGELAELLVETIPSAEMVKFGKNGSDAVTAAVKLARAYTGRDYIVRCSSDPFNAVHDWFIGSTVVNRGVPTAIQNLTLKFDYNDITTCERLFEIYPDNIACIILEPLSFEIPKENFLTQLKILCEKKGALLIFDEVVSGFKFSLGGAQQFTNVTPHLSAFGKAMANGYSISALVGAKEVMKLGGIKHNEERVFLMSSTYGGNTDAIAASLETIKQIKIHNAIDHFWDFGEKLMSLVNECAAQAGISNFVKTFGYGCKPGIQFQNECGEISPKIRTFVMQELAKHSILMPYVVPSLAHDSNTLLELRTALQDPFDTIGKIGHEQGIYDLIQGDIAKPVFRKFN